MLPLWNYNTKGKQTKRELNIRYFFPSRMVALFREAKTNLFYMENVRPKRVCVSVCSYRTFSGFAITRDAELGAWCEFKLACNADVCIGGVGEL